MPRKPRTVAAGLYHHVVHRGISRCSIFFDDSDRRMFLRYLARASERHAVEVLAFCLMDDHYHLLLRDPYAQLSPFMALVNGGYTTSINLRSRRDGALLRGRFFSRPSDNECYVLHALRYIHLNPVAAGLVATAKEFLWSSHRHYAAGAPCPVTSAGPAWAMLEAAGVARDRFDAWVGSSPSAFAYEWPEAGGAAPSKEGPAPASARPLSAEPILAGQAARAELADRRRRRHEEIFERVAGRFALPVEALRQHGQGADEQRTMARYVAAFLCTSHAGASYREVAALLGVSDRSVGSFVRRGRAALARRAPPAGGSISEPESLTQLLSGV